MSAMSSLGAAAPPASLRLPLAELGRRAALAVEGLVCCEEEP